MSGVAVEMGLFCIVFDRLITTFKSSRIPGMTPIAIVSLIVIKAEEYPQLESLDDHALFGLIFGKKFP
jgi:hypothetical protein